MDSMNKRERLEATVAGEAVDRPAVALWRHFPGDDQRAADLAAAHVWWQQTYDFDLLKVTPASSYCTQDWGVDIAEFAPGDVYQHVFTTPRTYAYYCTLHGTATAGMVGTVVVTG